MKTFSACLALSAAPVVAQAASPSMPAAPVAEQRPHSSTHHGITLDDPWHWLRDPKYPKVTDKKVLEGKELEEVLDLRAMTELGVPGGGKGVPVSG